MPGVAGPFASLCLLAAESALVAAWRWSAIPATAAIAGLAAAVAAHHALFAASARTARARVDHAGRDRDRLLSRMSHALRTPMNGILGGTDALLETPLDTEQKEAVAVVRSSAEDLLATLTNLLDHARARSGRLELESVAFDVRRAVHDAVRAQARRAHRRGIELAWSVSAETPETLRGDRRRLEQVLRNLVDNALAHTERGEIVVRVRTESLTDAAAVLAFEVADSGTGIPPEQRSAIASAIAAGRPVEPAGGRLGLGLAACSALVRRMGGTLWLGASPSGGTAIRFTARLALDPDIAAWRPCSAGVDLREREVLVVEDHETTRGVLSAMLRSWRGNPVPVASAGAAIAHLDDAYPRGRLPALAIVDVDLPGMPGLGLVEILRSDPRFARLPVVALASAPETVRDRLGKLAIAAVGKPVLQSELRDAARAALERASAERRNDDAIADGPPPGRPADPRRALRILVADDSRVDRTLAGRLLEKRGHAVTAVASGEEAVQACAAERFDVVLMDVQMPQLSGIEATAAIREQEARSGERVPIVALTADDDSARCLAAGMDGFVAKPVRPQELADAIALATAGSCSGATAPGEAHGPIDERAALDQAGGDRSLLVDLAQMCLADGPAAVDRIRSALAERDAAGIRRTAHRLRGSLLVLAAAPAARAAQRIETLCAEGRLDKAASALAALEREIARLRPVLSEIAQPVPDGAADALSGAPTPLRPGAPASLAS